MAGKMAERFGHDANVIGWQIDNEIGTETFDADTKAQWQAWLKAQVRDAGGVESAVDDGVLEQTYSDWSTDSDSRRSEVIRRCCWMAALCEDTWIS